MSCGEAVDRLWEEKLNPFSFLMKNPYFPTFPPKEKGYPHKPLVIHKKLGVTLLLLLFISFYSVV